MRNSQLQHGQHQQDGEHHPRQRGRIAEFQERKRVLEQHDAQNIGSRLGTTGSGWVAGSSGVTTLRVRQSSLRVWYLPMPITV